MAPSNDVIVMYCLHANTHKGGIVAASPVISGIVLASVVFFPVA